MTIHTWHKDHFTITSDKTLLDLDYIQRMLNTTYMEKLNPSQATACIVTSQGSATK